MCSRLDFSSRSLSTQCVTCKFLLSFCDSQLEEGRIRRKGSHGDCVLLFINLAL